jgi:hypothetical protein
MKKESANHTRFISGEKGSTSNIYLCSPSRWKQSELSWNHPWIRGAMQPVSQEGISLTEGCRGDEVQRTRAKSRI